VTHPLAVDIEFVQQADEDLDLLYGIYGGVPRTLFLICESIRPTETSRH
jgi:hypothetical protein